MNILSRNKHVSEITVKGNTSVITRENRPVIEVSSVGRQGASFVKEDNDILLGFGKTTQNYSFNAGQITSISYLDGYGYTSQLRTFNFSDGALSTIVDTFSYGGFSYTLTSPFSFADGEITTIIKNLNKE